MERSRTLRTPEVVVIAVRGHITRKKSRFHSKIISQIKAQNTSMQPLQCVVTTSRPQPAFLYAHGNTTWQHLCSHSILHCSLFFSDLQSLMPPCIAIYCSLIYNLSHCLSLQSIISYVIDDINSRTTLHYKSSVTTEVLTAQFPLIKNFIFFLV